MWSALVIGIVLIIFWAYMQKKRGDFFEGFEDSGKYKFVMYGASWCGYCKQAKPEFEKLGATKTIDGKVVEMSYVDADEKKEALKGKNISGYPTFHLYDPQGSLVKEYGDPSRTQADFDKFLNSSL